MIIERVSNHGAICTFRRWQQWFLKILKGWILFTEVQQFPLLIPIQVINTCSHFSFFPSYFSIKNNAVIKILGPSFDYFLRVAFKKWSSWVKTAYFWGFDTDYYRTPSNAAVVSLLLPVPPSSAVGLSMLHIFSCLYCLVVFLLVLIASSFLWPIFPFLLRLSAFYFYFLCWCVWVSRIIC